MRMPSLLGSLLVLCVTGSFAQQPAAVQMQCRDLSSAGNFVASDEVIVGDKVCKQVKSVSPQLSASTQQSSGAGTANPPKQADAQATTPSAKITNARVIEMTKMGLDEDVIIARIKHGTCDFQLSDNDLVGLKAAGVSSKVVAVMMDTVPTAPATPMEPSDGKVRVFVTDSQSWETRGSSAAGGNSNGWGATSSFSGGARPQTAEIIKTLNQRCPELTVTNVLGKADFVIVLDHEGGKGLLRHRNKVAVFNHNGDDIFSDSTRELGNAVKDACEAMTKAKK